MHFILFSHSISYLKISKWTKKMETLIGHYLIKQGDEVSNLLIIIYKNLKEKIDYYSKSDG